MRKAALALTLNLFLLFSVLSMSSVQAEEWSTIQASPSNFSICSDLSITYNGSKIAFWSYVKYYLGGGDPFFKDYKIFVANSDGTGLTEIARDCSFPALSGDGNKIAFTKNDYEVFVVNSDGTELTQIPGFPKYGYTLLSISGDGSVIAFTVSWKLFVSVNSDRVLSYSGSEDDAAPLETQQTMQTLEIVVAASAVVAVIIGTGLLVYFRKRKH
jgi:Tol biopolymer transport system component